MNGFALKLIAIITMFIDHFATTFEPVLGGWQFLFHAVGRMAFPIFVFMIAEGCSHTRDIRRYAARLGIFALISELPFDIWYQTVRLFPSTLVVFLTPDYQNVFFTLFLGVCAVYALKRRESPLLSVSTLLRLLVAAGITSLGHFLNTDYGAVGVLAIVLCALAPNRAVQLLVLLAMTLFLYAGYGAYGVLLMAGCAAAFLCIALYNGEKGAGGSWLKWVFYVFYPAHILFLFAMYELYIRFCL